MVCVVADLVMVQLHVARVVLEVVLGAKGCGVVVVARNFLVCHLVTTNSTPAIANQLVQATLAYTWRGVSLG